MSRNKSRETSDRFPIPAERQVPPAPMVKFHLHWLAYVLLLLPALLSMLYVHAYGVNIAWEDQLNNMPPVFEKWYAGTLQPGDFWRQINEHRVFFSGISVFLLALATHWNTLAEMHVVQMLLLAMLAVVVIVMRRTNGTSQHAWFSVPVAFMMFTLRQNQNMLSGYQMVFVMTAALSLATFLCLYLMTDSSRVIWKFSCGLLLATLAAFSVAQGLLVWIVGLAQLLALSLPWRRKIVLASIWTSIGILEWVVYFWGFIKPGWHPPWTFTWEYFLSIVGGALYPGPTLLVAQTAGGLLLVLTTVAILLALGDWQGGKHIFWLAMILFGLITEGQTTVGRAGGPEIGKWGVEQALSSRYATFSLFVVIGAYGIVCNITRKEFSRQAAAAWGGLVGLTAMGIVLSMSEGLQVGEAWWQERVYKDFVFCTSDTQPDEALPTAFWQKGSEVRPKLEFLKEHRLNVYRSPDHVASWTFPTQGLPVLPYPARIQPNQQINKKTGLITIMGIALDGKEDELVGGVFLEVDNKIYPAYYGYRCEDIAQRLKIAQEIAEVQRRLDQLEAADLQLVNETEPQAVQRRREIQGEMPGLHRRLADLRKQQELTASHISRCIFRRDFSVGQLGPGRHTLSIGAISKDRTTLYQPTNLGIEIPIVPDEPTNPGK
jgi:hypothetical protein